MRCPICNSLKVEKLIDIGSHPASLLEISKDPIKSKRLTCYPVQMMICHRCMHVWNKGYDPEDITYSAEGCRMYNDGPAWQKHVKELKETVESIPADTIIEIGAGDCEFLNSIETEAYVMAIDPCDAVEKAADYDISFTKEYFNADLDMYSYEGPLLIVMRHLLEHITSPRDFIEDIVRNAEKRDSATHMVIEVPCCQEALKHSRIEDWTYEHPHHFTVTSLMKLFRVCGIDWSSVNVAYGGEVAIGIVKIEPRADIGLTVQKTLNNYNKLKVGRRDANLWMKQRILEDDLVLWGGTGKSAIFINTFDMPVNTLVVDSHDAKWGFHVPGTMIPLLSPSRLKHEPPKYIIATTSWRASDIRDEIVRDNIPCKSLLKFEDGELVEVPLG